MFTSKDHSFVICAYKENPHLENTILSLLNQTVKSKVYISTSTPNDHIKSLCIKYNLELFVNKKPKNAGADWNWAYNNAPTSLVTIAHQDDLYESTFLEKTLETINGKEDFLIVFSDYYEIRNDKKVYTNTILKVKRLLLSPLRITNLEKSKFIKRFILAFGCPICCPATTYNKGYCGDSIFDTNFINSCDYKTWVDLSNLNGRFIFLREPLLGHRIYEESATSFNLSENIRKKEDLEILSLFWPKTIAKLINSVYALSEKSNDL